MERKAVSGAPSEDHTNFFREVLQAHAVLVMGLKNTHRDFFSVPRHEIKGIWVTQTLQCIYGQHPKSTSLTKAGCYFLCCDFKNCESVIWEAIIMKNDLVLTCWGVAGMSWNWRTDVDRTVLLIPLFISLGFSCLISIAILHSRGSFDAFHTSCDLYSK